MAGLLALPLVCALAQAGPPRARTAAPTWLRPAYHYTRAAYHMNDPNGLMYTTDPSTGNVTYHMFFHTQHARLRRSSVDFRASESSWIEALEGIGSSLAPS